MTVLQTREVVPLNDLNAMTAEVRPELDAAWDQAVTTSAFIGGEAVDRFEEEWSAYCGTRHAIGVANGTDAIELVLRALGIGAGDEVIIPTNTFVATLEGVLLAGALPRLVDVDDETLLLTPEIAAEAITDKTAAIVAVNLYGNMPRLDELAALAERSGIALLEDAAQAQGATWKGKAAGSFGLAGTFSFYPGKNLGAFGDAGAVVTDDGALADSVRMLANHGRPPHASHLHSVLARNSRLDALQAAVLSIRLSRLEAWNAARREAIRTYAELLPIDVRVLTVEPDAVSAHHQHVVRLDRRDEARESLRADGIESGIHYPIPCHLQPPYERYSTTSLPVAEQAAGEILSLPLFPHITESQIERVCSSLEDHVNG
ncbi:MAG TPA: DegT/DnrJ/EryC1/StrS family aminotransferase [Gaiellaceae bacterium]